MVPGLFVYDFEVTAYDWLLVIKDHDTGKKYRFWNDSDDLRYFFDETDVDGLVSFNGKGYDKYVLAGCYNKFSNERIKEINDYIIGGGNGFELRIKSPVSILKQIDLMDDVRQGTSLKSIEAHLGMSIVESSISFDVDHPLSEAEAEEMFTYCEYDVDMTDKLLDIRADYLETKIALGERCGLNPYEAMGFTNARLTAKLLGAVKTTFNKNERYELPTGIELKYVPKEILEFFKSLDGVNKTTFKWQIHDCTLVYSDGGLHGSVERQHFIMDDEWVCQNRDVASLYPSLLDIYKYISRACSNPNAYHDIKVERLTAKKNGDTKTASYLKSPLNATSGAQDSEYNDLYDPRTRFMRYTGQLLVSELVFALLEHIPDIKFINVNTDGFMYICRKSDVALVDEICRNWEKYSKLELETDDIKKVFIKDVNNLMFVKTNGKMKYVGGALTRGITNKGAMAINNNTVIVRDAVLAYLADNVPIEDTIRGCKDILKFQKIAKVSHKFTGAMQLIDGKEVEIQRCNRVYATINASYGKLYKRNRETGTWEQVASMPEHCLIDNDNHLTVEDIDLNYYIEEATKVANKFLSQGELVMADKKNVYQKLADCREDFLASGMKKTGVNKHAEFKYFQLEDIIPIAMEVFKKNKVIFHVSMDKDIAEGKFVNLEGDDVITICLPMAFIAEPAKFRMNECQANGSAITYMRKYLYFALFDLIEHDAIEEATPKKEDVKSEPIKVSVPKKPLTTEQRAEVKAELTGGNADEMLLKSLKSACQKLLKIDKEKYKKQIGDIQLKTEKFTTGDKATVEKWIKQINAEVAKVGN